MRKYRIAKKEDCHFLDIISKELKIFAMRELEDDNWIKILGFYDEQREGFVYLPYGTKIKILEKEFEFVRGELFVQNKSKRESILEDDKYIYVSDNCLKNNKGKMHRLRNYNGKYIEILL